MWVVVNPEAKDYSVRDMTEVLPRICARRDNRLHRSRHLRLGSAVNRSLWLMMVAMLALTVACASNPHDNIADGTDGSDVEEHADLEMSGAFRGLIDDWMSACDVSRQEERYEPRAVWTGDLRFEGSPTRVWGDGTVSCWA